MHKGMADNVDVESMTGQKVHGRMFRRRMQLTLLIPMCAAGLDRRSGGRHEADKLARGADREFCSRGEPACPAHGWGCLSRLCIRSMSPSSGMP